MGTEPGDYFVAFFAGSYDETGLGLLGAQLTLTDFETVSSLALPKCENTVSGDCLLDAADAPSDHTENCPGDLWGYTKTPKSAGTSCGTGTCDGNSNCIMPANVAGASSHGDPIIHTFNGECYDLDRDGLYIASSHRDWDHIVKVAVYNQYIREIQIP